MQIKIAPSILSADFGKMAQEVKRTEDAGADLLHCDVMDGVFVPNITFGPKMIADIRKATTLPLDVHLMIVEPEKYVEAFAKAGADYITIHVEATKKLVPTLKAIRGLGVKSGAVISPDTPVSAVEPALEYSDMVLLMSVYPGFGGQKFLEKSLDRLSELAGLVKKSKRKIDIEIDGGVTSDNVEAIKKAGANVIVAGNTIFGAASPKDMIRTLRGK